MIDKKALRQRGLITTGYHVPYNPKLKERARELRKNMTNSEKKLWQGYLRGLGFTVLRQKPIDNYIVDFYCAKAKLVIEVDGSVHDGEDAKDYDSQKDAVLEGYGLKILRLRNEEIINNFEAVCNRIQQIINSESTCSPPLIKEDGMAYAGKQKVATTSPSSKGIVGDSKAN